MATFDNILSASQGVGFGLALSEMKRLGDSMYAGRNLWSSAFFQMGQVGNATALADRALRSAGASTVPFALRSVLYLSPFLLGLVTTDWEEGAPRDPLQAVGPQEAEGEIWRSVAVFIQDHISDLCQVAAIVSSVALIFFGNVPFGVASLAMLGLGYLNRAAIFPDEARQVIIEYTRPVLYVTGLLTGNFFNILFTLIDIFSYCAGRYYRWVEEGREAPPLPENAMALVQIFLEENVELEVNRDYILWPTNARDVPNIDIQTLSEQFQAIGWDQDHPKYKENIKELRSKLGDDRRFKERCGDPAQKTDAELIEAARSQLSQCVTLVKERRIEAGAPRKYEQLIEYMQLIAHELPKKRPDAERIDALMKLAIEAGGYCGPQIIDAAEEVYGGLIGESEFFTTHSKVLNCLQSSRNRIVQGLYAFIFQLQEGNQIENESRVHDAVRLLVRSLGRIMRWDDPHNLHAFQNLFAEEFRLRKVGADNDALAAADYFLKLILSCLMGTEMQDRFWHIHSRQIVETISSAIGTPEIPVQEVRDWWLECIAGLDVSDERKAALREELVQAESTPGAYSHKFVRGMLLGMGILTIRQS